MTTSLAGLLAAVRAAGGRAYHELPAGSSWNARDDARITAEAAVWAASLGSVVATADPDVHVRVDGTPGPGGTRRWSVALDGGEFLSFLVHPTDQFWVLGPWSGRVGLGAALAHDAMIAAGIHAGRDPESEALQLRLVAAGVL